MEIWLNRVVRHEDSVLLEMTAFDAARQEVFCQPLSAPTARLIEAVLAERPFKPTKPGLYYWRVIGVAEGAGEPLTLAVEVHKGRSRLKRSVAVDRPLFLALWNLLHYQTLPSDLPEGRRSR